MTPKRCAIALLTTLLPVLAGAAVPPKIISTSLIGDEQTTSLILTPKYVAVGLPGVDVNSLVDAGEVRIFNRSNGKLARTVHSAAPVASEQFGQGLAFAGDQLFVGVPGAGRVDIIALSTGKKLGSFVPVSGIGTTSFGWSLAVEGSRLIVGAPGDNGQRGAVFVMNLKTRLQERKIIPADGSAGDDFGYSVSASGGVAVVGAPFDDHGAEADGGSAYLFDVTNGNQINKFIASDMAAGRFYGINTALRGEKAIVSSVKGDSDRGAVSLVDAPNALELLQFTNPAGPANGRFGLGLAVEGDLLVATSHISGTSFGGAFFFNLRTGTKLGDLLRTDGTLTGQTAYLPALQSGTLATAPLKAATAFGAIYPGIAASPGAKVVVVQGAPLLPALFAGSTLNGSIATNGTAAWISTLTGSGATAGKNKSVLLDNAPGVGILGPTGLSIGSLTFRDFLQVSSNWNDHLFIFMRADDSSQNVKNARYLLANGAGWLGVHVAEGAQAGPDLPGIVAKMHQIRQSYDNANRQWAMVFGLKTGKGFAAPAADTGVRMANGSNAGVFVDQEGSSAPFNAGDPPAPVFGEFAKRLACGEDAVFTTALTNAPAGTTQAVFRHPRAAAVSCIARQGNAAEGTTGAVFSTFLAEAGSTTGSVVFRATLKGGDSTSGNNEGLWHTIGGLRTLLVRKGDPVNGLNGEVWKKFLRFWTVGNQVLILGQIGGAGVNSSNDTVLMLAQENDTWAPVLLREGDPASGCPDARLGAVQRVEVDPSSGRYAVLVALAGAAGGENQALLSGNTLLDSPATHAGRRLPHLLLRKGALHQDQVYAIGRVRSMVVPGLPQDASGASGIGEARCINSAGTVMVTVDYGGGAKWLTKQSMP